MSPLRLRAENLVRTVITGSRKGSDEFAYLHSFRVAALMEGVDAAEEVVLAALLHDVIEDGEVTYQELKEMGCSARVIELVEICSHDPELPSSDGRWVCLMSGLIKANDLEAWMIKTADLLDNLRGSEGLSLERRVFMRTVKAPLFAHIVPDEITRLPLWTSFLEELKKHTPTVSS